MLRRSLVRFLSAGGAGPTGTATHIPADADAIVYDSSARSGEDVGVQERQAAETPPKPAPTPVRRLGRVVNWMSKRGYGFILDLNTNNTVMAHREHVEGQVHQMVEYDLENGYAEQHLLECPA